MLPAFFPKVSIVAKAPTDGRRYTVRSLCERAGIPCRVTGPSALRQIHLRYADEFEIAREPGSMGRVAIGVPHDDQASAVLALGALAYAVFDYTARESMRGRPERKTASVRGRPRKAHPLSGAERTKKWRAKLESATRESATRESATQLPIA